MCVGARSRARARTHAHTHTHTHTHTYTHTHTHTHTHIHTRMLEAIEPWGRVLGAWVEHRRRKATRGGQSKTATGRCGQGALGVELLVTGGLLSALRGWLHGAVGAQGGRGGRVAWPGTWEGGGGCGKGGSLPPSPVTCPSWH